MNGTYIKLAKKALIMFIRSLPSESKFSIISFGSNYKSMFIDGEDTIPYDDNTRESAF